MSNFVTAVCDVLIYKKSYSAQVWATLGLMLLSAVVGAYTDLSFSWSGYVWQIANWCAAARLPERGAPTADPSRSPPPLNPTRNAQHTTQPQPHPKHNTQPQPTTQQPTTRPRPNPKHDDPLAAASPRRTRSTCAP